MPHITRADCQHLDSQDGLRGLRERFALPSGVIYLDGNSLGAMPHAVAQRLQQTAASEWAQQLIGGWNQAGWYTLPARVASKIAPLLGAEAGDVMVGDNTSVNWYKVLSAAVAMAKVQDATRRVLLTELSNFPTDRYLAHSVAQQHGLTLREVPPHTIAQALGPEVAVLALTHVNYRTGAMHDLPDLARRCHAAGVLSAWDLAHSTGAVPLALPAWGADFAVGCGYKYLNGGPGAPAFWWVHPNRQTGLEQPIKGWFGHARPFAFVPDFEPAAGAAGLQTGTPPVLSLVALDEALEVFAQLAPVGGMQALRHKSVALTELFVALFDERLAGLGFALASPREAARRGSQVSVQFAGDGYALMQALIAQGVVGDFRAGSPTDQTPDLMRFGFAPLYNSFDEVWLAVQCIEQLAQQGTWQRPRQAARQGVT